MAAPLSRDKHSTTKPLQSLLLDSIINEWFAIQQMICYIILTYSTIENKEMLYHYLRYVIFIFRVKEI